MCTPAVVHLTQSTWGVSNIFMWWKKKNSQTDRGVGGKRVLESGLKCMKTQSDMKLHKVRTKQELRSILDIIWAKRLRKLSTNVDITCQFYCRCHREFGSRVKYIKILACVWHHLKPMLGLSRNAVIPTPRKRAAWRDQRRRLGFIIRSCF